MFQKSYILYFFLVCLFYCHSTNANVKQNTWLYPYKSIIVNRSIADNPSPWYVILPVDRTAFSVNYRAWLHQFDISKIFVYNPIKDGPDNVANVSVKIKIMEKTLSDMQNKAEIYCGFKLLNSTDETKITIFPEVKLNPKSMYEIQIFLPSYNFIYNENLNVKEQRVKRPLWRSLIITYYQNNIVDKPLDIIPGSQDSRLISHGMVKRLYLDFPKF